MGYTLDQLMATQICYHVPLSFQHLLRMVTSNRYTLQKFQAKAKPFLQNFGCLIARYIVIVQILGKVC